MEKIRHVAISFFELGIYVGLLVGVLVSVISGISVMNSFNGGFSGVVVIIGGTIASIVAAGAALTLVGIYHNSRK